MEAVEEHRLLRNGRDLSDRVAERIEARLETAPDCLEDRLLMIGYWGHITLDRIYSDRQAAESRLARQEAHVLWLIANHPSIELGDGLFGLPVPCTPASAAAWRAAILAHPTDAQVLWNAALAILFLDHVTSARSADELIELFTRIARLAPSRVPRITSLCADRLGLFEKRAESDRALARCALALALEVFPSVSDDELRAIT